MPLSKEFAGIIAFGSDIGEQNYLIIALIALLIFSKKGPVIHFVRNSPIGYDQANLLEIPVEGELIKNADFLIQQLRNSGAVTHASSVSQSITSGGNNTSSVNWPETVFFDVFHAGYDFVGASGVELVAGREFSEKFPIDTSRKTVMINETAAKVMKLKQPIGTTIKWGDQAMPIVGVYKDFVLSSPYERTHAMITQYIPTNWGVAIALRLNPTNSISTNVEKINTVLKSANPHYPPVINFVDSDFEKKFRTEQLLATLANIFGGLAIVISCLGLFRLASYAAEQRIKEIGVRKVLGASILSLTVLLSRDFIKLVGIAILIATPISLYVMNQWLTNYELRVSLSWWIFAFSSLITLSIALFTVSYQAIKAAQANPVKSLRSE